MPTPLPSTEEANRKLAAINATLEDENKHLKAALTVKDALLSQLSHELRTPLASIIGYSGLLSSPTLTPEEREAYLHTIHAAAESLLRLARDMPEVTASESGEWVLTPRPFTLQSLVPQWLGIFSPQAQKKGIGFSIHCDDALPEEVIGDAGRIRQIMNILIRNAIKFTEEGNVTVSIDALEITPEHATLQFLVQDSGHGIAPDKIDRLFEPSTPSPAPSSRHFGRATGNALALARQQAKLLGGSLHVTSEQGVGSRFSFLITLPIAPAEILPPHSADGQTTAWRTAHVLVVEDHPMNRAMLEKMLQNLGVGKISLAEQGDAALQLLAREPVDLILMDCQMPVMDGFAATQAIKHSSKLQHIPVIGITADAIRSDVAKCFAAGMDDYFTKPLHLKTLRQILQRWLAN